MSYPSKRRRRTVTVESRETSETSTESVYVDLSTLANAADVLSPTREVSRQLVWQIEQQSAGDLVRPEAIKIHGRRALSQSTPML